MRARVCPQHVERSEAHADALLQFLVKLHHERAYTVLARVVAAPSSFRPDSGTGNIFDPERMLSLGVQVQSPLDLLLLQQKPSPDSEATKTTYLATYISPRTLPYTLGLHSNTYHYKHHRQPILANSRPLLSTRTTTRWIPARNYRSRLHDLTHSDPPGHSMTRRPTQEGQRLEPARSPATSKRRQ